VSVKIRKDRVNPNDTYIKPREIHMIANSMMNPIVRKRSTRAEPVYMAYTAELLGQDIRGVKVYQYTPRRMSMISTAAVRTKAENISKMTNPWQASEKTIILVASI
jgi:hypothetical protein